MQPPKSTIQNIELAVGDEPVPGLLQLPSSNLPVPAVLLLHGFSSSKSRVADTVGRALVRRGVASLAIDLPMHGTRAGRIDELSLRNPLALVQAWRLAVREANEAIRFLINHRAVDPAEIAIAGYSLGAYLAVAVASSNPGVRAVALAAGGDLPEQMPFAPLIRTIVDPLRAIRALSGRPLFMANGLRDRTVTPTQARALFAAAGEPKEIHWYEGGHWPPSDVVDRIAEWLATKLAPSRQSRTA